MKPIHVKPTKSSNSLVYAVRKLGLPVIDAKQDLILNVTKEDIGKSKKKDVNFCAIATAGRRNKLFQAVQILRTCANVLVDGKLYHYVLPEREQKEIVCFDRTGIMAPGKYVLKAPPPSRTRVAAAKTKRALTKAGKIGKSSMKNRRMVDMRSVYAS
jgi:hypothetical protein